MPVCNSSHFTTSEPRSLLWKNSIPMLGAILALFSYDLLESGLLALQSEDTLSAFGFTLPLTAVMTALAIGLSIRSNNKVIQINCTNKSSISNELMKSLLTCCAVVVIFSIGFYVAQKPLLSLTGNIYTLENSANAALAKQQSGYFQFRTFGWVFLALIWQVSAMLRALGWMKTASRLIFGWAVIKSLLLILLFTPQSPYFSNNLAALGAMHLVTDFALAVLSIYILHLKTGFLFGKKDISWHGIFSLNKNAYLVTLQQFITPISMLALTAFAATLDTSYVAALALLFRIEAIVLLLPMVLTTSMPALVGANFWYDKQQRVTQIYKIAFATIFFIQLGLAALVYTQSHLVANFICPHDSISIHLSYYLKWVPWGYTITGIVIVLQACLNAKDKTVYATVLGISHRLLLTIPLAVLGATQVGMVGFYQGLLIGHMAAVIPVIIILLKSGTITFDHFKSKSILSNGQY